MPPPFSLPLLPPLVLHQIAREEEEKEEEGGGGGGEKGSYVNSLIVVHKKEKKATNVREIRFYIFPF